MMALFLSSVALLLATGLAALFFRKGSLIAVAGCVIAGLLGLIPVLGSLFTSAAFTLRIGWDVPFGAFSLEIDPLSAFFLLPVFLLSPMAALYGQSYLKGQGGHVKSWFFWNSLVSSMAVLVAARNAVLFLVAWEIMSLCSFFLVVCEHRHAESRRAGWIYLVSMHLGTAFIVALFLLLGNSAQSFDFSEFPQAGIVSSPAATLLFFLSVVGFGTKAGFVPLHVWLPEAHPAAPSHVSALMSGVMIKMGIYGLVRTLTFFSTYPFSWAAVLIAVGALSGILGVLFAIAQHDVKRLLAYHSVENIGIITLGLGIGLLGTSLQLPFVAVIGFAGGLLHVLNHAVFKSLLFLGAGAVAVRAGTRDMDQLGGLLKRMPRTGVTFFIGAAAIAGLPPLNGFVSELLIFYAGFDSIVQGSVPVAAATIAAVAALSLIGGLAVACFTKVFGIVFLGEPRSPKAEQAHEADALMTGPMLVLASLCGLIALTSPMILGVFKGILPGLTHLSEAACSFRLDRAAHTLEGFLVAAAAVIVITAVLVWVRRRLLSGRPQTVVVTWDCGYVKPSARMQYTSSSFAQPLVDLFAHVLRTHKHLEAPAGHFPSIASIRTHTADIFRRLLFDPLFAAVQRALIAGHFLQHGRVHLYVLYIALTLLILFAVKLQ
ncbi:MAG: proton-conducting transporter membrane subunit [Desulfobacterales bacterium]|nr:proton-conducting transporter membrane subunit [Desulfobacterales bacterium]